MSPTLLLMAAGMGSRYGGLKQVEPMGPGGESLVDYAVYDALRAGFARVVFVLRRDIEADFRDTVLARLRRGGVGAEYVFQDLTDLPAAGDVDVGHRRKPWGTAHAVWSARDAIRGPFAVLNADDYYGPGAYRLLHAHLTSGTPDYAVIGYELAPTLSAHGSVARGILAQDSGGYLTEIVERTRIERLPDGRVVDGAASAKTELDPGADVSMNIMGFTPRIFPQLQAALTDFLRAAGREAKSELYLPNVVGALVARGEARVRVLSTDDEWFGVTYAADAGAVRARLRDLVAAGVYPPRLWG